MNLSRARGPKPRLCIVMPHHWSVSSGGAEFQVNCLTDELVTTGKYDISFVARAAPSEQKPGQLDVRGIADSPKRPRLGYLMDSAPLYKTLLRVRPDVLYQRVGCGYTGIAALFGRRYRVPMIWHVAHDTDVSPSVLPGSPNFLTRTLEKHALQFGLRNAFKIICQTHEQARLLEHHYDRRADAVIPNFHPAPRELIDKSGPLTVLWIANLKRFKRPEIFVRLAAELRDLRDVRFIMVGSPATASRRDRQWQQELAQAISNTPNLQYVGPKSQAQVNEWLASSHLLVSTSMKEGFPNTFVQAWLRRVSVVSLDVDPDRVLRDAGMGICVNSAEQLAGAVRDLLKDTARRDLLGMRAQCYALEQHSLKNIKMIEQIIDACLPARFADPRPYE